MKQRADVALVARGLADSREKAQALILAGRVYISETRVEKASRPVGEEEHLLVRGDDAGYASRGGYKLQKAMEVFKVDAEGLVCMDVGAAAGGFTDVLLRAGARHVYAIDVGYGQMDWRIRQDARVTVMERTNARHLVPEQFPMMPQLAVMDVSFISIRLIIPVLFSLMGKEGRLISLVKPQFEAGRGQVGKHGVVREADTHLRVLRDIRDFVAQQGLCLADCTFSPITGPKGNVEFLADIGYDMNRSMDDVALAEVVSQAHRGLL